LLANGGVAPGQHHIHPAYVITNALRALVSLILVFFTLFSSLAAYLGELSGKFSLWFIIIPVLLALLSIVLTLLISYVSYIRFLWEITESDIHIYSGVIFKKQVHIPFQRVQSIDFNATIVDRVLGLVKLKIETAGGAFNKGVSIPSLKLGEAEALRAEVFARRNSLSQGNRGAAVGAVGAASGASAAAAAAAGVASAPFAAPGAPSASGMPLAPALASGAAPAPAHTADTLVRGIGDEAAKLRGIFADDYQENAPIEYEYGLSAGELIFTALSSDQLLVFFAIVSAGTAQLLSLFSSFSEIIGLDSLDKLAGQAIEYALQELALPVLFSGGVFLFIFTVIMLILGTVATYGGFKVRRRGGRIELEHGLLARQYRSVSVSRVQSIEIRQGFIRRIFGYASLKLLTIDSLDTSGAQQNKGTVQPTGLTVHPFVKVSKIEGIMERLVPEFAGRPASTELRKLPRVALRRAVIRRALLPGLLYALCVLALVLVFASLPVPPFVARLVPGAAGALASLIFILQLIDSFLWYRHAAYAYNLSMLTIRKGGFEAVTTIIPRKKIQWATVRQNPLQRMVRLSSISAVTAAGVSGTTTVLPDLAREDADAFFEWMRPR
jgi:putative membrane protein